MAVFATRSAFQLWVSAATRCAETGVFRFVFDAGDVEVSADLTVAWLEQDRCAWLRYIAVERVQTRDRALAAAVEAWVLANHEAVFSAALDAEAA